MGSYWWQSERAGCGGIRRGGGQLTKNEQRDQQHKVILNLDSQRVVVNFGTTIRGWTVGAGGFDNISKILEHGLTKEVTATQFSALIRLDNSRTNTEFLHEGL
jgi:hypothetical protein